jgi:ribosome-binding protein aMBF1 (putative translation factor)
MIDRHITLNIISPKFIGGIMETKKCSKCGRELSLDHYGINYKPTGALKSECYSCYADYARIYRQNNPEQKKKDDKRYYLRHKEKAKENSYRLRKENPLLHPAQNKVYRAVKSGKLIKSKFCEICGRDVNIVSHHKDYTKPLDVMWVCQKCHANIHGRGLKRMS